jgi:methylthioribose-1-phosphate isomerase
MFSSDDLSSLRRNLNSGLVEIIDQTLLPHELKWCSLDSLDAYCHAIEVMQVRGAPLIGVTAACGLAFAVSEDASDANIKASAAQLLATRPTAVNLRWALEQVRTAIEGSPESERAAAAWTRAMAIRDEDIDHCSRIGDCGLEQLRSLADKSGTETLNIMTHCNAGWLATIQWGTALAPVYKAHAAGIPVHVWVSETRPRNQGMNLTAWELQRAGRRKPNHRIGTGTVLATHLEHLIRAALFNRNLVAVRAQPIHRRRRKTHKKRDITGISRQCF